MTEKPKPSERAQLEEVAALRRKRHGRACDKAVAAQAELVAASAALDEVRADIAAWDDRLAAWIKANPDPQGSIFEELSNV